MKNLLKYIGVINNISFNKFNKTYHQNSKTMNRNTFKRYQNAVITYSKSKTDAAHSENDKVKRRSRSCEFVADDGCSNMGVAVK